MNRFNQIVFLASVAFVIWTSATSSGQEWTRFRGPNGTGESDTKIPAKWTERDYKWKVAVPGKGHSSPVLWGNRLFLMSADPNNATRYLLCYDATNGKVIWEKSFPSLTYTLHKQSSYASGTAAVDADAVIFAWADPESVVLISLTHDGEVNWKRDLGPWVSQHGFGTSPLIFEDLVIVSNSQEIKDQPTPHCSMLAVDRKTGKDVWNVPRDSSNTSYSVPAVFQPAKGKAQLVCTNTGDGVYAFDPHTGKKLWSAPAIDKRTVSSPVVKGDLVLGSTGSGGGGNYVVAVHSDGNEAKVQYKISGSAAPYVPTTVTFEDYVFLMSDGGIASCYKLRTGDQVWQHRVGGNFSSSLVRAHDVIYAISSAGDIVTFAAAPKFVELGNVNLGEEIRSTPAIANGKMYLRTVGHLMAIGN